MPALSNFYSEKENNNILETYIKLQPEMLCKT